MRRLFGKRRPPLVASKLDIIDFAIERLGTRTFADLGGVWAVEAGYTFYALDRGAQGGVLVDTHPSDTVLAKARQHRNLRVILGNFGSDDVATDVGDIDAVFFFDTLLHQAAPDWDQVLEMYTARAACVLVYNPQWVGPGRVVRLFDLGEDEYFRNVPHPPEGLYGELFQKLDTPHPDHGGRLWRNVHHIWQWGITDAALIGKMQDLGYRLQYFANDGRFERLDNFENHAFVFSR